MTSDPNPTEQPRPAENSRKRHTLLKRVLVGVAALVVILAVAFGVYVSDYYHATSAYDPNVVADPSMAVQVEHEGGLTIFRPPASMESTVGLIFYPGGKVEAAAYAPLMAQFADQGITAVLVEMPFNLAVFGIDRADQVYSVVPEVTTWYIGGHSLGGAMASSYAVKHPDKVEGLILMGAYPASDMSGVRNASGKKMPALQIIGTNDRVVDRDKLSPSAQTVEIEGGNHAYFGDYGEQKGDGKAAITPELQQAQAVEASIQFIRSSIP